MRQTGLTLHKPEKAYQGYTLFSPREGSNAYLIDMQGNIVHRWQMERRPGDYGYLLENDNLLISGRTGKGPVTSEAAAALSWNWTGTETRYGSSRKTPYTTTSAGWTTAKQWSWDGKLSPQK